MTSNALSSITNTSTFIITNGNTLNISFVGTAGGAANISLGRYLTGFTPTAFPFP